MNGLENKAEPDNIIYRYEGPTVDIKFNKLDNVLNFLDKIREGEISLDDAEKDQIEFKSNLDEKKGNQKTKLEEEKKYYIILKCFTKQGTMALNFFRITLQ